MKKGATLVEVLVSIVVIMTISIALIFTINGINNMIIKQKEYHHVNTILNDIAKYSDKYNKEWDKYYFELTSSLENNSIYLDKNFNKTTTEDGIYLLTYKYIDDDYGRDSLIVSITKPGEYDLVTDFNYGGYRYDQ